MINRQTSANKDMTHNLRVNYMSQYYAEDATDIVADYSDCDVVDENQKPHVYPNFTEGYSQGPRPKTVPTPFVTFQNRFNQHPDSGSQYRFRCDCDKNPPQHSPSAAPFQSYSSYECNPYHPVITLSQQDTSCQNRYEPVYFRDHHGNIAHSYCYRNIQEVSHHRQHEASKQPNIKRCPITVGTPKYYRKAPPSSILCKKPSALCLPLAVKPEPTSLVRKMKKPSSKEYENQDYEVRQDTTDTTCASVLKNNADPELVSHKMNSEGDFSIRISSLEEMLDKLEKDQLPQKNKDKTDVSKLSKFLKPRVPLSVKARQQKIKQKSKPSDIKSEVISETTEEREKTNDPAIDSLEKLLKTLKKCELVANNAHETTVNQEQQNSNEKPANEAGDAVYKNELTDDETKKQVLRNNPKTKSFNYQDITNQISRTLEESKGFSDSAHGSTCSIQDITRKIHSLSSSSSCGKPRSRVPQPPLDDNCALELHKSKSYIVNLIDRALSKELGTVPGDRGRRQFDNMSPKKAIDTVTRHIRKNEKDLSMEITSAITESIISHATAPQEETEEVKSNTSPSKSKVCCCNSEEPIYIKHLKQLRWGHLKHIQREVRRLEDLERFLDSCSITTIPEV